MTNPKQVKPPRASFTCDLCGARGIAAYFTMVLTNNGTTARACSVCVHRKNLQAIPAQMSVPTSQQPRPDRQEELAERVGVEMWPCDCGLVVPISETVRTTRKPEPRAVRVCRLCQQQVTCQSSKHVMEVPASLHWDEDYYEFKPLPEAVRPGVCRVCGLRAYWDSTDKQWRRMTWSVLAEAWAKVSDDV